MLEKTLSAVAQNGHIRRSATSMAPPHGWFGRSVTWFQSNCSRAFDKVSYCFSNLTLNKAAAALVISSCIGGVVHAISNQYPYVGKNDYCDWAGGAAHAIDLTFVISSVTALVQHFRARKNDAREWGWIAAMSLMIRGLCSEKIIMRNDEAAHTQWHLAYSKIAAQCHAPTTELNVSNETIYRLDCSLIDIAKTLIDSDLVATLTRSAAGASGVFFVNTAPLVIK